MNLQYFPVREDLKYYDSILVTIGNKNITGTLYFYDSEEVIVLMEHDKLHYESYIRYKKIVLFCGNKKVMYINRKDIEIKAYQSRIILIEKFTNTSNLKYTFL